MNALEERAFYKTRWLIRRFADDAAFARGEVSEVVGGDGQVLPAESIIDGNILLSEGIGELWDLVCGLGSPIAFSNANAYIGVGDSTTAESAAHTDLQAASNKTYKAMSATYPQRSGTTVTFQAAMASGDANYSWQEFTVANASSGTGKNLNRKVSNQGSKVAGQVWTIQLQITIS